MPKYLFLSVLVVVGLGFSVKALQRAVFIPIEVVSITDKLQYADPTAIKSVMSAHIKEGFFALRVGMIRDELKKISWVTDANVQRCWPNTVKIKIFERQPLAIWHEQGVVDTEGKLFFPPDISKLGGLPEFVGNEIDVDSMVETYLLMLSALKPIGLAVKRLEIMSDQGWRAMLDNGVTVILGQFELEERLARFVLAYNVVVGTDQKIKVVDLRYTNGLAVG